MCADRGIRENGFTLLEVIVAFAIAALALVGLFRAGSGGLFAVDTAARAEEAVQRAPSHLAAGGRDAAVVEGEVTGADRGGYPRARRGSPRPSPATLGQVGR